MDREELRLIAAGQFASANRGQAMSLDQMDRFVEGAVFAFDLMNKKKKQGAPWEASDQGVSLNSTSRSAGASDPGTSSRGLT